MTTDVKSCCCSFSPPHLSPLTCQPVTVPKPFNFSLERRIADRKTYQEGLEKKQRDAEEREKVAKLEREEEEKKELKEYRKSLNFKVCDCACVLCVRVCMLGKGPMWRRV